MNRGETQYSPTNYQVTKHRATVRLSDWFWRRKFHWGRKLEGHKWFRGWCIHHRANMSIKFVTWRIRVFGRVLTV